MSIKAIETRYKGYRFRSRLEARWAVFFDALGLEWHYEAEGYEYPELFTVNWRGYKSYYAGGKYLPDFYMPRLDCFIEIKGKEPDDSESLKASLFSFHSRKPVYVFFGPIPSDADVGWDAGDCAGSAYAYWYAPDKGEEPTIGADQGHLWCECPECGDIGIEYMGRSRRLAYVPTCRWFGDPVDAKGYNSDSPALLAAYAAARSARFEYGEQG